MTHSTKKFYYDAERKTLSIDVSDLGPNPWIQAYPDSIDLGLDIISHLTGSPVRFVVNHEERVDNELVAWELIPTDSTLRNAPSTRGITLVVYND